MKISFIMERGDPPRLNPIFADVFGRLERAGVNVAVRFPEEELIRLNDLAIDADLYCLKSDGEMALSLATVLDGMGARILNPLDATLLAKDKVTAAYLLARADIPAPIAFAAPAAAEFQARLTRGPLILKPHRGYHGAGVRVARSGADLASTNYPGVVFAQDYLERARVDLKVYAIGEQIFGVRKAFSRESFLHEGESAPLSNEIIGIARRIGAIFGLELFGLDIAEAGCGPRVVDVNYFPGYRGVPDAARLLTDYFLRALRCC
ncbi:MAG TPA: hypothetical protein VL754_12240 [Verrucomicrobiae bacterium]|nr:hypothetical protein [Verrucomicrobiae bacterium]